MGGGKSSSSSSNSTTNQDNRVVADAGAIAVGNSANVQYSYVQGLDERAAQIVNSAFDVSKQSNKTAGDVTSQVLNVIRDVAVGAGSAVSDALKTTQSVAERQQVSPTGNAVADFFKQPAVVAAAAGVSIIAILSMQKR